ncbi:hypothetical protein [Rhodoflexus caldus]|uniref:hypothetical protein n=1 Tax=Rhodoflexus caldus TaxID=2891236 RepID=UPI002029F862|nr:hypothetical protein [Rhodoflexus caldus]
MKYLCLLLLWLAGQTAAAQDSLPPAPKFTLNGYLKSMQSLSYPKNFEPLTANNLIHNRLNMRWKPVGGLTFALELRNRILWGDEVRAIPNYAEQLRNTNESVNLSLVPVNTASLVMHLNTERLWAEYKTERWQLRLGRQRLNWGITTTWNPNDIFNTFNFLDFDYEERPGSDAARLQYNISDFSNVEVAFAPGSKQGQAVGAVKYFINKGGYDWQLIAGVYQNRLTLGGGWAGNIKNAGFKGEVQFFAAHRNPQAHVNVSLESNYVFANGWFISGGLLYNSEGISEIPTDLQQLNFNFSPLHLMPTRWNFLAGMGKEITPPLSANLSVLYAPGPNLTLLLPSLRYNPATNLDVDIVWQSFFASLPAYEALNHRAFMRFKWSF